MMKQSLLLAAVALALAACSSSPKVDPALEGADSQGVTGSISTGVADGESGVQPIQVSPDLSEGAGPADVGRVIYFGFDQYVIEPEYQSVVDGNARYLRNHGASSVVLEGNTDARGSREYNLALGQRRAEAVRRAMLLIGASESQMEAVSFGAENPAASGSSESAYAQNRRVDIRYR